MSEQDRKNLVSTKVTLAGRTYPIKAEQEEIDHILAVVKEVEQKIESFKKAYPSRDIQDCLSMTLLTYAVEASPHTELDADDLDEKVSRAHEILDEVLSV